MDLEDACMPDQPTAARNYFLACYAVSLIQGDTIQGITIRSRTVKHYIADAKVLFSTRNIPTKDLHSPDYLETILQAHKAYESVPNRRSMITDTMMIWLHEAAQKEGEDSELRAICDWLILGRYTGFRKGEWCQSSQSTYERIDNWPGRPPLAMILSDFQFLGKGEKRLNLHDIRHLSYEELSKRIEHLEIQWRKQKNGDNGEKISYSRDRSNPKYCPVLAGIRIMLRALRAGLPAEEPIGVFRNRHNKRKFITDTLVTKHLRLAAMHALDIKKGDPALQLWSTHSVRVTAANLLHRARFADSFIQKRLRWKSTTFLMYLRNTIYSANEHAKALQISDSNLPPVVERTYRAVEPHEAITLAPAA